MPRLRMFTTGTRPRDARTRRLSLTALGVTPVLIAGGLALGTQLGQGDDDVALTVGGSVTLTGHGHGHGRGLGQWGAYGYAKKGWSANRILSHYYGGTTAGKAGRSEIDVVLTNQSSVSVRAGAGMRVGGQTVAPGQAVSLSGGTANITSGCGGPVVRSVPATFVEPLNAGPSRPAGEILTFCGSGAKYRGKLGYAGGRVVNRIHIDDYVKGVLPKEISPGWADGGGMEAIKAQAVAARTYALAALAGGKQIDDTQNSQVYGGASVEDPRTNTAADATAGQVRLVGGKPAFTEFSASTGGYTAGGQFPAVQDDGDSISPSHNWSMTLSPDTIGSAFGVGALRSFEVVEANGLGPNWGRAAKVRVVGSARSVDVSGEDARTTLGLKSSFFAIKGQTSKPKIVTPPRGAGSSFGSLETIFDEILPGASQLLSVGTQLMSGKFDDLGGITGLLGQAIGVPGLTPDGQGVVQLFQRGMMFFSADTGVHALAGRALADYQSKGGQPVLGFPKRDALR